jgi:predicted aminopeptidase
MRKTRSQFTVTLSLAALLAMLLNSGCAAPSYYSQAVAGHIQLMKQRQDIQQILDSGAADPELTQKLQLSLEIRSFAVAELDLPDNDSYTQFVSTGQDAVTWNVLAAPEFSLAPKKWCFLVSGCVPYRGYFKAGDAERFAKNLDDKGFDTFVSPAIAYSTLGWFDDPLVDTMFRYDDAQLAGFIFHEMAHQKLYVKGDTSFNEAYARFVEDSGLERWLAARDAGIEHDESRWSAQTAQRFNALIQSLRHQLEQLYASDQAPAELRAGKSRIFKAFKNDYRQLVTKHAGGKDPYRHVFAGDLNNASLVLVNAYEGGSCAFENLFREAAEQMAEFHRLAAAKARQSATARSDWLNQPCQIIASDSDL